MKKRVWVIAGVVIIVMSGLTNIALPRTEDAQWTPYVLRWNEKLPAVKKKRIAKKQEPITVCASSTKKKTTQR